MSELTIKERLEQLQLLSNDRKVIGGLIAVALAQQAVIDEQGAAIERQRQAILRTAKEIDRLKGVHGA